MALEIQAEPVPLHEDSDGVIRVAKTRVTLDTVVTAFQGGATAEEIVQQYDSLSLAEVYAVIAYYICRQPEVDEYLRGQHDDAAKVRQEIEKACPPAGFRERLLARRPAGR